MSAAPDAPSRSRRGCGTRCATVEDPEIPISVVGMGLIVSLAYAPARAPRVDLEITFTAMGCPAMDFIEDDIRDAPAGATPTSTRSRSRSCGTRSGRKDRIRDDARATMRELGIVA